MTLHVTCPAICDSKNSTVSTPYNVVDGCMTDVFIDPQTTNGRARVRAYQSEQREGARTDLHEATISVSFRPNLKIDLNLPRAFRNEEEEEKRKKREAQRKLLELNQQANSEAIREKVEVKEWEKNEDKKIAQYLLDKAQKDKELADEQERIKAAREREYAKMRAAQEKLIDNRVKFHSTTL